MKYILIFVCLFSMNYYFSQDVVNSYLSLVKFRMSKVVNNLPTSVCNPEDIGNVEEWRFRVQVSDSPNDDGLGWTSTGCYIRDVEGAGWTTYPNFEYYLKEWTSPNRTVMSYYQFFQSWEDDINPDCELNTGDQCEFLNPYTSPVANIPDGNCDYPGSWHPLYTPFGSSTRNVDIEYYYEIDPNIGTVANYANTFQFEAIDDTGCPNVSHCMNNENRGGMNTYYTFELLNRRRIAIDLSIQPGNLVFNVYDNEVYAGGGTNALSAYSSVSNVKKYDLEPGIYYIRVSRTTATKGDYRLRIYNDNSEPFYWTGINGTDWHNSSNWSPCQLPNSNNQVVIPVTATNQPTINSGNTGQCKIIQVENGSKLTIQNGGTLNTNN